MPRKPRLHSKADTYHVVVKGIDSQLIFTESKDYQKYLEILTFFKEECQFELYAFCLMSNHIHLLIHVNDISLETIFRKINTQYAVWFNMKYQRTGPVQDGRFYSEPVEDERYLLTAAQYIHLNPTKAGLEKFPGESYPWSSIYEYKNLSEILVNTDYIYNIVSPSSFLNYDNMPDDVKILDIDHTRRRIPDDIARDAILSECNSHNPTEFQKLPLLERNRHLKNLYKVGLSIRQLNRLTGIPKGQITRVVSKG